VFRKLLRRVGGGHLAELPGYSALGVIRQGSMSTIFKAHCQETGQIVAIKILKPGARKAVAKLEALYRDFTEGQITAAFDHPNVVKCLGHGDLAGIPYIVLEYLEGVTLASLMAGESKRLAGHRMTTLHQTAAGLAHVHDRRFVHNDFCQKNIFVTNDNRVKVIDFGLTTPLLNRPRHRSRMGTPEILAPEVLKREPCDHRADIFAWGVVAYELLTGQWPFESPEHHQTLNKILNITPVPVGRLVPGLAEEVANLVMKCLAKEPVTRPSSMQRAVSILSRHLDVGI